MEQPAVRVSGEYVMGEMHKYKPVHLWGHNYHEAQRILSDYSLSTYLGASVLYIGRWVKEDATTRRKRKYRAKPNPSEFALAYRIDGGEYVIKKAWGGGCYAIGSTPEETARRFIAALKVKGEL